MNEQVVLESKQFVTFKLGENEFGMDILKVTSIVRMSKITRVPKTPFYVRGVINQRGEIIPVMDLRLKFNLSAIEDTDDTRIIIFKSQDISMGIIVDSVSEVIKLENENIENITTLTNDLSMDYILGVGKLDGRIVTLLSADRIIEFTEEK